MERNADAEEPVMGEVPAGGQGADSGAADVVRVDPDSTAPLQNTSSMNDIPGVGTRAADGGMETRVTQDDGPGGADGERADGDEGVDGED